MSSKPKGGLGRGLGSLIGGMSTPAPVRVNPTGDFSSEPIDTGEGDLKIHYVAPAAINENPRQPRTYFSPEALSDLKASILEHGILQPLVVTEMGSGKYELIAGERRLRASRELGLEKIPVLVRPRVDDQGKLELALIENLQRQDLNAVEEARAYQMLMDDFGLNLDDIAARVGKGKSTISNSIRLLDLDQDILEALAQDKISRSHARTLLAEPVPTRRREMYKQMLAGKMTVRQAEAKAGTKTRLSSRGKDPNILALESELREKLGTKVVIDAHGTTGKVSVFYYSKEDLKNLLNKLSGHAS